MWAGQGGGGRRVAAAPTAEGTSTPALSSSAAGAVADADGAPPGVGNDGAALVGDDGNAVSPAGVWKGDVPFPRGSGYAAVVAGSGTRGSDAGGLTLGVEVTQQHDRNLCNRWKQINGLS